MNIRTILAEKKISQNQLAQLARVPQSNLSMIINGKLFPCPAWRKRIAEALDVKESEIFKEGGGSDV